MAKYEVEFDRDGKITIRDPEFIRRLKMILLQDRRLTIGFLPEVPESIALTNMRCPPDSYCPLPNSDKCPGPEDAYCPMYLIDVPTDIRNEWVRDQVWKELGR